MRIIIKDETQKGFSLRLPTGLVLNRATAFLASRYIRVEGISVRQVLRLMKTIRNYKHQHPDWTLVEVESAAGEMIYIQF